jgi:hypothetical protein
MTNELVDADLWQRCLVPRARCVAPEPVTGDHQPVVQNGTTPRILSWDHDTHRVHPQRSVKPTTNRNPAN